jgi:hypothetical protein
MKRLRPDYLRGIGTTQEVAEEAELAEQRA